ncbi:MAG: hypothetical protein KF892_12560 [Rhizobacter sp.]|nr:hypothetical protein [Rhizobacter sp.]
MARLLRGVMWLGASLLLLVLAWVLSNVYDEDPLPLAPQLKEAPVTLAPRENAYFGLIGLWSPDEDYIDAGFAQWDDAQLWLAAHPVRERGPDEVLPPFDEDRTEALKNASSFATCERFKPCFALWDTKPEIVMGAAAAREETLERCKELAALRHEEEPGVPDVISPMMASQGLVECMKVLHADTLIAWRQARPSEALKSLVASRQLAVQALMGGRTLITHMIGVRYLGLTYEWAAHMASERPEWRDRLSVIAAPLPPQALDMRRAFRYEAALDRSGAGLMRDACHGGLSQKMSFGVHLLRMGACDGAFPLAFHAEQTRNERQPGWVAFMDALAQPAPAALEWARAQPEPPTQWWRRIAWRNSGTRYLQLEAPMRGYAKYVARGYDVELQRLGLVAALALGDERRDIHATLTAANREPYAGTRLHWDASTRSVAMTLWESVDTAIVVRLPTAR